MAENTGIHIVNARKALEILDMFVESRVKPANAGKTDDGVLREVLMFFGARVFKGLSAVRLLCENGFGTEALPIVRSLMEAYVSVAYISKEDSLDRARKYAEYAMVMRGSLAAKLNKRGSEILEFQPDEWGKVVAEVSLKSKEVSDRHGYKKGEGAFRWTGMDRCDLAVCIGDPDFDLYYHKASEHVHVLPTVSIDYQTDSTESDARWVTGPSENEVVVASALTCRYVHMTLVVLDLKLELGLLKELTELDVNLGKLLSEHER